MAIRTQKSSRPAVIVSTSRLVLGRSCMHIGYTYWHCSYTLIGISVSTLTVHVLSGYDRMT